MSAQEGRKKEAIGFNEGQKQPGADAHGRSSEPSDSVSEFTFHLGLCPPDDFRPGHDHQVETLLLGTLETTKTSP